MVLGDGIRRNIAYVDPLERTLFIEAFKELNNRYFPGEETDFPNLPAGHVSYWFKQDEIHQSTHIHGRAEFLPWHREIVNRLEKMLREIDSRLSMHYWDWTQDPRNIPDANLGNGVTGVLNLFTEDFMGWGGLEDESIGEPWESAKFYDKETFFNREATGNPAHPPLDVTRHIADNVPLGTKSEDDDILIMKDYTPMYQAMIGIHDRMHGFVSMGPTHRSFEDPFVFLLHSNVDRLYARWQTDPAHLERLNPNDVYGTDPESKKILEVLVEPWSTGHAIDQTFGEEHFIRPWCAPDNLGQKKYYKDLSIILPPLYDTNHSIGWYSLRKILKKKNILPPVSIRKVAEDFGLNPPFSIMKLIQKIGK